MILPDSVGEIARRKFLGQLRDHYQSYVVELRRGTVGKDGRVSFHDLKFTSSRLDSDDEPSHPDVEIEELTVHHRAEWDRIENRDNPLVSERVQIKGLQAYVHRKSNGRWSFEGLLPLPDFGPAAPLMEINDVTVHYVGEHASPATRPMTVHLDRIVIRSRGAGQPKRILVEGSASFADRIIAEIHQGESTSVRASIEGLRLDRDVVASIIDLPDGFDLVKSFELISDIQASVLWKSGETPRFNVDASVSDGSIELRTVDRAIRGFRGKLIATPELVSIETAQCQWYDSIITGNGAFSPANPAGTFVGKLDAESFPLKDSLASLLPIALKQKWKDFQPAGIVDLHLRRSLPKASPSLAVSVNQTPQVVGWVACRGVDVQFHKFPYPARHLTGIIQLDSERVRSESLVGRLGGTRVQCLFDQPINAAVSPQRYLKLSTDGALAIDRTLLNAMTPRGEPVSKLQRFAESLSATGQARLLSGEFWVNDDGRKRRRLDVQISGGGLKYAKFPYPLDAVEGRIHVHDEVVRLEGFQSHNAGTIIRCDGICRLQASTQQSRQTPSQANPRLAGQGIYPQSNGDFALELDFQGTDVRMDGTLRHALPSESQAAWDQLAPSGTLDQLAVGLRMRTFAEKPSIQVVAKQLGDATINHRTLSIRPTSVPYRLDIRDGTATYDGVSIGLQSMHATHDQTRIIADGRCYRVPDGRW
ncbi:MAG: hypothetical protein AAF664_19640, partial [Planctomycetota bacterium]